MYTINLTEVVKSTIKILLGKIEFVQGYITYMYKFNLMWKYEIVIIFDLIRKEILF